MSKYIEREAALQFVFDACAECMDACHDLNIKTDCDECMLEGVKLKLRDLPAAVVRPVITCGECKHWFENGTDYCSCDRDALLRERDFFCAAGEKREES